MPAKLYSRRLAITSLLWIANLVISALMVPANATADEPMLKFAEALRERGYFGVAIDYLEQVKPSQLSAESQALLPLEKAATYNRAATVSRDLREADSLLSDAQKAIESYQPSDISDADAARGARFRGDLLLNRARITQARIATEKPSQSQREQMLDQTRSYLTAGGKEYESATKSLILALQNFQLDPEDSSSKNVLKQLRGQYTYLKTRGPAIKEQLANTLQDQKQEREKNLKEAAAEAKAVWSKYRSPLYPAAIQSCMTAARCFQELQELESSQQMIDELFTLDRSDISASVRREALSIAATNWKSANPFPWEDVLAKSEAAVKMLTPNEAVHPQWQPVQLALAQALHEKSKSLAGKKGATAKRDAQLASETAVKLAKTIAQTPGDNREQAVSLLKAWGAGSDVSSTAQTSVSDVKPESFAKAVQLGNAILPDIQSILPKIRAAEQKLQQASSDPEKQQAQKELDQLKQKQFAQTGSALKLFDHAIRLVDESVTGDQVNNVRYLQCYCYFAREQYIESTVIAEFMIDKYPNLTGTRPAAAILLRNRTAVLDQTTDDKAYKNEQLTLSCKTIIDRYPGTSEAYTAAARLAWLSLENDDTDQAKTWFNQIPEGDPQRVGLALSMGRRQWFAWSKSNSDQAGGQQKQLASAKQYLAEGVVNSKPDALTYAAAEGALLLTQALLASGEVDKAIEQLESAEVAPLKLIDPVHPALTSVGRVKLYHQQTATTAIKSYMAAMARSSSGQKEWIDKCSAIITGLQERLKGSNDPNDIKRLTFLYRLTSQRLIEQLDSLAAGEPRSDFAVRLASLLAKIEKDSQDSRTVVWAGSTLLSVANTLRQDGAAAQSETIFKQAVAALDRAEKIGFGDGAEAEAMTREMKRQRALAQRGAGNYKESLHQFTQILTAKAGDLSIQLDAATTLQQQAAAKKDVNGFAASILGSSPVANPKTKRKQNAIWGWRKLVQVTRGKAQYQDAFYQSLYHMIEARYEMGRLNKSPEGIGKALKELDNWQQRTPNFDNGVWKEKFGQLRQRIKKQ